MRRVLASVVAVLGLVMAGCSGGDSAAPAPAVDEGPAVTYVAVGASDSVGVGADDPLREAWPQVLYNTALPRKTTFVNLGVPGITVAEALEKEVPHAVSLEPTLVTVWLNVNDITRLVSAADYEQQLGDLVRRLRRDGRSKVLVANTPPVEYFPAYLACLPTAPAGSPPCALNEVVRLLLPGPEAVTPIVAAYNEATARVVQREGAVLVDLHALALRTRAAGQEASMFAGDGFHPSAAGHRAVAQAFADALKASGGVG